MWVYSWGGNLCRLGYIEEESGIMVCPTFAKGMEWKYGGWSYLRCYGSYHTNNWWKPDAYIYDGQHRFIFSNLLKNPSFVPMFVDSWTSKDGSLGNTPGPHYCVRLESDWGYYVKFSHNERCNQMFFDGHAGSVTPGEMAKNMTRMPLLDNLQSGNFYFLTEDSTYVHITY